MAGRRTNLALLGLLPMAVGTGALAFAVGGGWARWAAVAHGVVGLGIVLLAPWKSVIARRGIRRRRDGTWQSVALSALAVAAVFTGIGHATGLLRSLGPVTAMQVHVVSALGAIPFALLHVLSRRVHASRTDLSRRALLRSGLLAAGSAGIYAALAAAGTAFRFPGRHRRATGSFERGSMNPPAMPVTQWLDDRVPTVDADGWTLALVPAARETRLLTLAQLDAMREPVRALLDCTGGWFAEQEWEGVPLDRLLGGRPASARSLVVRSATGYSRRYPVGDGPGIWLATRVGGEPLSSGHGFPARIVAPNRRGFWWVKWVTAIESSSAPWWWQPPFPLT